MELRVVSRVVSPPASVEPTAAAQRCVADGTGLSVAAVVLPGGLGLPVAARAGDAGVDLCTTVDAEIGPGERRLVPTGLALALPAGYVGLVHPRSGLAARVGLTVLNAPGTVDSGYRGEIMVCLVNHDPVHPVSLVRGDRIAQLLVQRVEQVCFTQVDELPASERGHAGHGSTGGSAHLLHAATPTTTMGSVLTGSTTEGQEEI